MRERLLKLAVGVDRSESLRLPLTESNTPSRSVSVVALIMNVSTKSSPGSLQPLLLSPFHEWPLVHSLKVLRDYLALFQSSPDWPPRRGCEIFTATR